jgi:hypothetical protein
VAMSSDVRYFGYPVFRKQGKLTQLCMVNWQSLSVSKKRCHFMEPWSVVAENLKTARHWELSYSTWMRSHLDAHDLNDTFKYSVLICKNV